MFVYDERVKKYVRKPAKVKPIGSGRNAGCPRSMQGARDHQHQFKISTYGKIFHRWTA